MPLNHTFRVAYLLFQVVMVAFTVMMVAFSAKGGYDLDALEGLIRGRRTIQMRLLRCDLHEINRLMRRRDAFHTCVLLCHFGNVTQLIETRWYRPHSTPLIARKNALIGPFLDLFDRPTQSRFSPK
jgi:hypothetical protein